MSVGKVARLVTRKEREDRAIAAAAAQFIRDLPGELLEQLPRGVRAAIATAQSGLRRHANPDESVWPGGYNMISRVQTKHVWKQIQELPPEARPIQVRDAFMFVLLCLDQDTGEVSLTREELAREIGCSPRSVSSIMGTLEKLGVLTRERRPEPGVRGLGRAVYVVNAHTAWNGKMEFRQKAAATQEKPSERRSKLKAVPPPEAAE